LNGGKKTLNYIDRREGVDRERKYVEEKA